MAKANKVLIRCLWQIGHWNEILTWVDVLDGIDRWDIYLKTVADRLTESEMASFTSDANKAFFWGKPWLWSRYKEIPRGYVIQVDDLGHPIKDSKWWYLYFDNKSWKEISLHDIPFKKERMFWILSKDKKRMIAAPDWYAKVKNIMLNYPEYAEKSGLLSVSGADNLKKRMQDFFTDIELWKWKENRWKILFTAFNDWRGTHWYLLSKMMPNFFDIIENENSIKQYFWLEVSRDDLPDFREAVSSLATKSKVSTLTVLDLLWQDFRRYYWLDVPLLFKYENWKPIRLEEAITWKLTKEYLLWLSIDNQIEQLQKIFWNKFTLSKFQAYIKLKLWSNVWWYIFRFVNIIWSPPVFAAMMSLSAWVRWFASLLSLNSWMIIGERIAWKTFSWNWKALSKKHWLGRWLPVVEDVLDTTMWLGDFARKYTVGLYELYRQWLFNVSEPLVVWLYHQDQMARFFKELFPWVKNWDEIDVLLTQIKNSDPYRYSQILEAAHMYADHVMWKMFNQHSKSAVNNSQPAIYWTSRSYIETLVSMRNFFASWWLNKIRWTMNVLLTASDNTFWTKLSSQYIDLAAYNPKDLHLLKTLQEKEFEFLINKLYRTLKIWKYLDRMSETDSKKDSESVFEDVQDMFYFASVMNADLSALDSTPFWRIVKNFLSMVSKSIEIDMEGEQWIQVTDSLGTWLSAGVFEALRSFSRKLFIPKMLTDVYSSIEEWELKEKSLTEIFFRAVQRGSTGFMYILDDSFSVGWYTKKMQIGPWSWVARAFWLVDPNKEFIMETNKVTRLRNMFNSKDVFKTTIMYWVPFLKEYFWAKNKEFTEFYEKLDEFTKTETARWIIDWKLPVDVYDSDLIHMYNSLIVSLPIKRKDVSSSFYLDKSFEKDWKIISQRKKQALVDVLHSLKELWVGETDAKDALEVIENFNVTDNKRDAMTRALYVMDYLEKKSPWSSLVALAYVVNNKIFKDVYWSWEKYNKILDADKIQEKRNKAIISAMKEYWSLALLSDTRYTMHQFFLHYLKTHNEDLWKYITESNEKHSNQLKLEAPDTVGSKQLKHTLQSFIYMSVAAREWIDNPDLLLSEYSQLLDINKYRKSDWTLSPETASYFLNVLSLTTKQIDTLAVDEKTKHTLKMSTLTLWDDLFSYVVKDKRLMGKDDIKKVVSDWAEIYFEELKSVDRLAEEIAEEEFEEKKYGKNKKTWRGWGASAYLKTPKWFLKWYDHLKTKYYNQYHNYRKPLRWPRKSYERDYLRESEFLKAKRAIDLRWVRSIADVKAKANAAIARGKGKDDNWILSVGRRGKSIANYVREDIDKPVEYKTPWRKRWVRKWKWVAPISTTTWKHLTPKPRKK